MHREWVREQGGPILTHADRYIYISPSYSTDGCSVDISTTSSLPDCLDDLLLALSQIVNDSLLSGSFPSVFKYAVCKHLLKRFALDDNNLKNYRPV